MSTTAKFPAADVAAAAEAVNARLLKEAQGPDGIRAINHDALHRSDVLMRFAAAAARHPQIDMNLCAEDFELIGPDLTKIEVSGPG